jgi:toxin ParE1/3/4
VKVSFHPAARRELREASAYYRREGGIALAQMFQKEIERVTTLLAANPAFGKPTRYGERRYLLKRFPYTLIYYPVPDGIHVMVLAHQSRSPEYWHDRR